jgi:hypothetical protein
MKKEAERQAICVAETALSACKDMDLIVAGIGGLFVGFSLAEKFDILFFRLIIFPSRLHETSPVFFSLNYLRDSTVFLIAYLIILCVR